MRFIASVNAFMIIAHEVSGSRGGMSVYEETNIDRFVEYAKMNPYSVYLCPGESGTEIEATVRRMFKEGRSPGSLKRETRFLPLRMAFIHPDEVIPANMEKVTRRLANGNRQIREVVLALGTAHGFSHRREFSFWITTAASPVPAGTLWKSLFVTATDCAIYALRKLALKPVFADEAGDFGEGLYGVQTITTDLMGFIESSDMDEKYKAIFRAWPTTA